METESKKEIDIDWLRAEWMLEWQCFLQYLRSISAEPACLLPVPLFISLCVPVPRSIYTFFEVKVNVCFISLASFCFVYSLSVRVFFSMIVKFNDHIVINRYNVKTTRLRIVLLSGSSHTVWHQSDNIQREIGRFKTLGI